MAGLGRALILAGTLLALVGVLLSLAGRIPGLGKVPGDLVFRKGGFTLYLPLTTALLVSLLLTVLLSLFSRR